MERDGDRQEKMEGDFSTDQSPQRAVVSMEGEEEVTYYVSENTRNNKVDIYSINL
jgi:O-glycosyl hydrolase